MSRVLIIDQSKSPQVTHQKEPLWLCRRSKCTLGVRRWSQQIPAGPEGERLNVTSNQRQLWRPSLTNRKPGQSTDSPRGQSSHRGQRLRRGRRSACCCALPRSRLWRRSYPLAQTPTIINEMWISIFQNYFSLKPKRPQTKTHQNNRQGFNKSMKESPVFSYIEIILLNDACIENSIHTRSSIWR